MRNSVRNHATVFHPAPGILLRWRLGPEVSGRSRCGSVPSGRRFRGKRICVIPVKEGDKGNPDAYGWCVVCASPGGRSQSANPSHDGRWPGRSHGDALMSEVTAILDLAPCEPATAAQLLPLVYHDLRRLAAHQLAHEPPGQTLEPTALVHEAYLRLVGDSAGENWDGRGHFFAAAAEAMRRILVENARRRHSLKHGGGMVRQPLDEAALQAPQPREDLLALDEALTQLAAADSAAAALVQLRYFGGLSIPHAAQVLGMSPRSADRLWAYARAWLHQRIQAAGRYADPS